MDAVVELNGMKTLCTSKMSSLRRVAQGPRVRAKPHACGKSGRLLEGLDGLEHFVDMAWHLETAPFGLEHPVGTDQKGAALDALDLLSVHDLVLDHAEHVAHL